MNKPLEELSRSFVKSKLKLVVFDIDGVIIPTGTQIHESPDGSELSVKTMRPSKDFVDMVTRLKKHVYVAFSSGRSLLYLQNMLSDVLWDKVALQSENGNFTLVNGQIKQMYRYEPEYFQKITNIRNDFKALFHSHPGFMRGFEPKHLIVTIHSERDDELINSIVKKHDPEGELYCQWTNEGYDVGKKGMNKGASVSMLCSQMLIPTSDIITTGNNLNDAEMLQVGHGVSVDPDRVSGEYGIPKQDGVLGGEVLAKYLLNIQDYK